jgi:hypothetical protein
MLARRAPIHPANGICAMSLTYDQRSEIRIAFDEAYVAPERRGAMRVKYEVDAEIVPWLKSRPGIPFTVRIEDFSPTGVGIIHTSALPIDSEFVLKVPRPDGDPLAVQLTVVRNKPIDDFRFIVGMVINNVLDNRALDRKARALEETRAPRRPGRRVKIWFLLFGIAGILTALWIQ